MQTAAGDLRADEIMVERHHVLVFRVKSRIVGPDDAEGVGEDALLQRQPLESVKGRLHRARRALIDVLRINSYDWEPPTA